MLTENQKNLIYALADAGIDEDLSCAIVSAMEDEQMPILTAYIIGELEEGEKVIESKVVEAMLIINGDLEVEEDDE